MATIMAPAVKKTALLSSEQYDVVANRKKELEQKLRIFGPLLEDRNQLEAELVATRKRLADHYRARLAQSMGAG